MELTANLQEAIIIGIMVVSLTLVTCMGTVSGDDYVKVMSAFAGYIFGRVLNGVQGK